MIKRTIVVVSTALMLTGCFHQPDFQHLRTVHSGFGSEGATGFSLCGIELEYEADFNPNITVAKLKQEYSLETLDKEAAEISMDNASKSAANLTPPATIDGYFYLPTFPQTNEELEYSISKYAPNNAKRIQMEKVLAFRASSPLSFEEALPILDKFKKEEEAYYQNARASIKSKVNGAYASLMPKYETASCLYGVDEYVGYGKMLQDRDKAYGAMEELYRRNAESIKDDAYLQIVKTLSEKGIEYDEVVYVNLSRGSEYFQIRKGYNNLGYVSGYYSLHPSAFKYLLHFRLPKHSEKYFNVYLH